MEPATLQMRTKSGPLVVLDRCVLSFRRIERIIPENANFVLTDTFFYEAATADPESEGPKFNRWAKRFAERLFFARYWDYLSREETQPGVPVDPRDIMDDAFTKLLRHEVSANGLEWDAFANPEVQEEFAEKEQRVDAFKNLCARFSGTALERAPNWRRELASEEKEVELVRQPAFIASFVQDGNEGKQGEAWKAALSVFPDRHAVARWARLVAWYAIQYSLGRTKDFGNNYFDAEYAFAASYVGRLATTDGGLKRAVSAVFPDVEILSD